MPLMLGAKRKSLKPWMHDSIEYYQHQADGVRKLMNMKSFLLADDMGLGKSLQAMTVFAVDVKRGWGDTCLVVAPTSLKGNWAEEFEKFTTFPTVTLNGPPALRLQQLTMFTMLEGPKVLITNYEQVKGHLEELNAINFHVCIIDEAHYIKNFKSQRTKAIHNLRARRFFLLTGTPMLNHANELWSLLHRISPNTYPNYWKFVNEYCVFGGFNDKQIVGVKNEKRLKERTQDVMLRRLKSEVLDLPEVQIIERKVDLSDEQRKLYDKVVDEMTLEKVGEPKPMEIENALTKFLRLKQICGTTLEFSGVDVSSKLDLAVEDDLEILANGEKIVTFTQFRSVLGAYVARLKSEGVAVFELSGDVPIPERSGVVAAWAAHPGPAVLACMLQVAGVGLNMTAARHGSFLDELFVPGLNQQAIDRMHRIGADLFQPVQIRKYLCRNTIEARVQAILKVKSKLFGELIESDPQWKAKLYKALMEEEEAA